MGGVLVGGLRGRQAGRQTGKGGGAGGGAPCPGQASTAAGRGACGCAGVRGRWGGAAVVARPPAHLLVAHAAVEQVDAAQRSVHGVLQLGALRARVCVRGGGGWHPCRGAPPRSRARTAAARRSAHTRPRMRAPQAQHAHACALAWGQTPISPYTVFMSRRRSCPSTIVSPACVWVCGAGVGMDGWGVGRQWVFANGRQARSLTRGGLQEASEDVDGGALALQSGLVQWEGGEGAVG